MSNKRHAEVIGGGFAGLTMATALAQTGWSVRLHEKNDSLRDFGAGILLWRNALMSLEHLGAAKGIREAGMRPLTYNTSLNGKLVAEEMEGFPYWAIPRPKLHSLLVEAAVSAGVEVVTDSEAIKASPDGTVTFADGSELTADLIVGADGAGSNIRNSMSEFAQERQKYKDGVIRVLVPRPEEFKGEEWDRVIDYWTFEPDVMRVLYIPCNENEIYMGLMAETKNEAASALPLNSEVWVARFPHLAPLLRSAEHAEGYRHDSYQTNHVTPWSNGKVVLVGDAANAMCPALGQGASIAIVNAVELALTLQKNPDVNDALIEWEQNQREVTDLTQKISGEMAATRNMSNGGGFSADVIGIAAYRSPHLPAEIEDLYPLDYR